MICKEINFIWLQLQQQVSNQKWIHTRHFWCMKHWCSTHLSQLLIPAISTWSTLLLATIHESPRIKTVCSLSIALIISKISTPTVFYMEWSMENLSTYLHVFSGEERGLPSVGTMQLHATSACGCIILRTCAIGCLAFAILASKDAVPCQQRPWYLIKDPSYNVPGGHREDENRESELHGERLRVLRVYCCENDIVVILSWSLAFIFLSSA